MDSPPEVVSSLSKKRRSGASRSTTRTLMLRKDGARKMAREWVRAGLAERAERELRDVAKFVSYRTDVGADFHLQLAEVLDLCARKTEASRMRMRVQREAESSSARWQAKRALAGPDAARARERSGEQELGQLFQMPDRWD